MARPQIVSGEIYHVFNRGVDKRIVFTGDNDYFRFIFSLYECNDANEVVMRDRIGERLVRNSKAISIGSTYGDSKREPIVEIIAFTLMPNHYHLILRQVVEGGISLFMKKLGNSYTGYFNGKHERKGMGALFQGRFKIVRVGDNDQFLHLVEYIFSNPVEIIEPGWKEEGIKNTKKAIEFLNDYRWSSYLDSVGIKNFPSVTQRDFLWKAFAGVDNIEKGQLRVKNSTEKWIKSREIPSKNLAALARLSLE
ncbi:MAG: transposase [Candidatus Omnitrophica bacterium]|nr:transposase [Candidatus Omnitrophota bacterium]